MGRKFEGQKARYEKNKKKLLADKTICEKNRDLFKEFLEWEEYKLKRINNLPKLDDRSYKTMTNFLIYLRNSNKWFKNKAWELLTKEDIKKVYDDLEDGVIKNCNGKPIGDRTSYYGKVFKAKPFQMVGKSEIAREVLEFMKPQGNDEVAFIIEEDFKKLVAVAIKPTHKLLLLLSWDIGENINSLLELQKEDFTRQLNEETKEPEYLVNLPKEKLKRSRTARSELTNFKLTTDFLDIVLKDLKEKDKVFNFKYRQAQQIIGRAVRITGIKTRGTSKKNPSWKDLRSSMACHLLNLGWHTDEINSRLGHKPSSSTIDKYVTFLAKKNNKPKKRIFESNLTDVKIKLEELKQREKLKDKRIEEMQESNKSLKEIIVKVMNRIDEIDKKQTKEILLVKN